MQLVKRRKSALVAAEWMRTEGPRGMTVEEEEAGDADADDATRAGRRKKAGSLKSRSFQGNY